MTTRNAPDKLSTSTALALVDPTDHHALKSLIEAREDAFVLIDERYTIVAANARYARQFGLLPQQLRGFKCHEVSHHRSTPCHEHGEACPLRMVMDSGQPTEVVHVHFGCGNQTDTVRIHGYPVHLGGQRLLGESLHPLAAAPPAAEADTDTSNGADLVGHSPVWRATLDHLKRLARHPSPVLLLGESGVGKHLAARFIHQQSPRRGQPWAELDCSSLAPDQAALTLFGRSADRYGGAASGPPGLLESADGGSLLLNEIADLPLPAQARLCQVMASGQLRPLGQGRPRRVDVRLICTTRRHLAAEVRAGRFRADLFFSLGGGTVNLPPLRARRDDIPALAEHFLARLRERSGEPVRLAPDALAWLQAQPFAGNVRQLGQLLAHAAAQAPDGCIGAAVLAALDSAGELPLPRRASLKRRVVVSAKVLDDCLARHGGQRAPTAAALGITERTLYRWLQGRRGTPAD